MVKLLLEDSISRLIALLTVLLFLAMAISVGSLDFETQDENVLIIRSADGEGKNTLASKESRGSYGNIFVEIFENNDHIDKDKTTALVRTMDQRLYLWGTGPIIPPSYDNTMNIDTKSHGGGFSPKYNEYWYPQWSGSTIYRYDINRNYIGTFNSGQSTIMQLWGDKDGTYYTANYNNDRVCKWGDMNNNQIWSTHLGSSYYVNGVCCDEDYVYAMKYYTNQVYVMRKDNGQRVPEKEFTVNGPPYMYGGLACANGYLYIGGFNRNFQQVGIYSLDDHTQVATFQVACNIYNMAFDGEYYCVSQNSNTVHRYKISDGNAYYANELESPTNVTYAQSKVIHRSLATIGAANVRWYEYTPEGTEILYKITADGEHWESLENNTNHIFQYQGSPMRWNITLKTDDKAISPYVDKLVINYDYVKPPEPNLPKSDVWLGTSRPKLEWNFSDPDRFDHQSDYLLEIYDDPDLTELAYNTSWVNSSDSQHQIEEDLEDGYYWWRARTKDAFHAAGNFSEAKRFRIDITEPVGNITIEDDIVSVNSQLVYISLSAYDEASGVKDMQLINDQGIAQQWEPYKTEKRIALSPTDGKKTVGVRFRDRAGIVSDVYNDSIYLDYKGPGDINVTSSTHPDPLVYYNTTEPVFEWSRPFEMTGIKGYSYLIDEAPTTEPVKDTEVELSSTNNYTAPGEFTGYADGIWFFHVSAVDVYDQWSNTSHFQFNIDSRAPESTYCYPSAVDWFKTEEVECTIIFEDKGGFGLDLDTLEYSYQKHNDTSFSTWSNSGLELEVLKTGIQNNPVQVQASVKLKVQEGDDNRVRWRISDFAGNGPVIGEECRVKVDLASPDFSMPVPESTVYTNEIAVDCGITITDKGSGVDGESIQFSVSYDGLDENKLGNWTGIGETGVKEEMTILINLDFKPGKDNYIRWRVRDSVGNKYAVSDPYLVWVNSPPVPIIKSPLAVIVNKEFTLDSNGTFDNEGDELSYTWHIKNRTTKDLLFEEDGPSVTYSFSETGDYIIYLIVDDGKGFSESAKVQIACRTTVSGTSPGGNKNGNEKSGDGGVSTFLKERWWIIAIVLGVFLAALISLNFIVSKRRNEAEQEEIRRKTLEKKQSQIYIPSTSGRYSDSSPSPPSYQPYNTNMYNSRSSDSQTDNSAVSQGYEPSVETAQQIPDNSHEKPSGMPQIMRNGIVAPGTDEDGGKENPTATLDQPGISYTLPVTTVSNDKPVLLQEKKSKKRPLPPPPP